MKTTKSTLAALILLSTVLPSLAKPNSLGIEVSPPLQTAKNNFTEQEEGRISISQQAWTVKPGHNLRETLQEWATRARWSLVWGLPDEDDFRIDTGNDYQGDFKTAVKALFDSIPQKIRIYAELRVDNTPPLIYISREEGTR